MNSRKKNITASRNNRPVKDLSYVVHIIIITKLSREHNERDSHIGSSRRDLRFYFKILFLLILKESVKGHKLN